MSEQRLPSFAPAVVPAPHLSSPAGSPALLPQLVDVLFALTGASTPTEVAKTAVAGAVSLTGARAGALGVRRGDQIEFLATDGYDCDSMEVGARLPLDAGLPITEAVRTGRPVVRGAAGEPAWIAAPVLAAEVDGALLVSLTPGSTADTHAIRTIAGAAAAAFARCARPAAQQESVEPPSTARWEPPGWLDAAHVQRSADGAYALGGDIVLLIPGVTPDVTWLVVADVCGSGFRAGAEAERVRQVLTDLAAVDLPPTRLLEATDRVLLRDAGVERFVTAVAVRLQRRGDTVVAAVANAGHPAVLVRQDERVDAVPGGGRPLNLAGLDLPICDGAAGLTLRPGDVLLAYTDGLVDRGRLDLTDDVVRLLSETTATSADEVLATVLAGVDDAGPAADDIAAVAIRVD